MDFRYGIGSFVYRARRPFDPMKLYRLIEGKFILLQEEAEEDEDDEDDEDDEEEEKDEEVADAAVHSSDADSDSNRPSSSASDSNKSSTEETQLSDAAILANKKLSPHFSGLHRSKGVFWLATRPSQMGSWSTAGAMLTLGSEMSWFCCMPEEDWGADEETVKAIKKDFDSDWGDRRQELVFIGEKLDVKGLTKLLDSCLLTRTEMRKWEAVMRDNKLDEEAKEEKLAEMWDDGYWAEWARMEADEEHDHDHGHGHSHNH